MIITSFRRTDRGFWDRPDFGGHVMKSSTGSEVEPNEQDDETGATA